ncbi:MAG: type II toxin-antitoxin system HicA family toxin [Candidatus Tectomicrobia bacterium]|uniref:Type II toxin-antitoxin system HicA family toxin n=1 Tax=Tectimicrobiota bacterium TaxID=2528274 RepID=A0A933GLU9_UNCTE|nr:type II toxin-antitoxin system HicA family toxin [Candidatus Tectomicrobia bacterium]
MGRRKKIIHRFLSRPSDFTWQELVSLLNGFGYVQAKAGKTGGSRVRFIHETLPPIILHKPQPMPALKKYQLEQIEETLRKEGLI